MLFSSMVFLWWFLPVVLLLYFALPRCLRNSLLLIASLFFYAWGEPIYVFLMIGSIALNYCGGMAVSLAQKQGWKKFWVGVDVAANLGLLGFFKYSEFAINNIAAHLEKWDRNSGRSCPTGFGWHCPSAFRSIRSRR